MENTSPPSYDEAIIGINSSHPSVGRSYAKPPIGFVVPNTNPNISPVQQHPIHTTNYPQQQGQQHQTQPANVVYIQRHLMPLGPRPVYLRCPHCDIQKLTRIEPEPSTRTHIMAALLCILGFWCCVCLPYCMESCMNVNHYCGNCNNFLGTYNSENVIQ